MVRRGRVAAAAGRIGLMGIIGNRDPDLPGDQHTQFGAEQGAPMPAGPTLQNGHSQL